MYIVILIILIALAIWSLIDLWKCFFDEKEQNKNIYRDAHHRKNYRK